jgi:glutathione S-transferase
VRRWSDGVLAPSLARILVPDIYQMIHPKDQPYFRESREARLGISIEALAAQRSENMPAFLAALQTLRVTLKGQKFLGGETPLYADHIVFGALQWGVTTSSTPLLEADDRVFEWMQAVLDYYGDRVQL